ncbi:MAG: nucleotidyltransferase domain-containing protein [Actinomycetota bacterium]|nr:nucleotidyltransferase domain-containing protein [Actinomycetota bacterium]
MPSTWSVEDGKAVWDGRRLADWVSHLVDDHVRTFRPAEIWLYGSVARGDDDGDSDIDLLVVLDAYDPADAVGLKTTALRASTTPVPFDVSFTDPQRFTNRSGVPGTIERAAVLEGRRVYIRE